MNLSHVDRTPVDFLIIPEYAAALRNHTALKREVKLRISQV